ncbi:DpnD/PcfM family protein [Streptomyces sp. NPDC005329]|uniref:DpnD/PcfM family protein n=1 Tax=Streptomyces sp. NPDC005329 TaxID=3157034 RepID=UPI0033BAA462
MPKFRVKLAETTQYVIEVEAEDRDEAAELADEMYCSSSDPDAEYGASAWVREVSSVTCLREAVAHAV